LLNTLQLAPNKNSGFNQIDFQRSFVNDQGLLIYVNEYFISDKSLPIID